MHLIDYLIYLFLITGVILSIITKKLTVAGAVTAGIIGLLVFKGGGYTGILLLTLFFVAGTAATGWQLNRKKTNRYCRRK